MEEIQAHHSLRLASEPSFARPRRLGDVGRQFQRSFFDALMSERQGTKSVLVSQNISSDFTTPAMSPRVLHVVGC